jgi:hypothetical protein
MGNIVRSPINSPGGSNYSPDPHKKGAVAEALDALFETLASLFGLLGTALVIVLKYLAITAAIVVLSVGSIALIVILVSQIFFPTIGSMPLALATILSTIGNFEFSGVPNLILDALSGFLIGFVIGKVRFLFVRKELSDDLISATFDPEVVLTAARVGKVFIWVHVITGLASGFIVGLMGLPLIFSGLTRLPTYTSHVLTVNGVLGPGGGPPPWGAHLAISLSILLIVFALTVLISALSVTTMSAIGKEMISETAKTGGKSTGMALALALRHLPKQSRPLELELSPRSTGPDRARAFVAHIKKKWFWGTIAGGLYMGAITGAVQALLVLALLEIMRHSGGGP